MSARERLIALEPLAAADPSAIRVVRAPGRVNLIGEHTDYNLGYVLPAAIDLEIHLAFVPTADRRVEVTSEATGERGAFDLDDIGPKRVGPGSTTSPARPGRWPGTGFATRGFRGVLSSTLPQSSGLSSSAALELAAAWALAVEPGAGVPPLELARTCQRAENAYVGVNCGLMDQFASACGIGGAAVAARLPEPGVAAGATPTRVPCAGRLPHRVHPLAERIGIQRAPRPMRERGGGDRRCRPSGAFPAGRDRGDAPARPGSAR